MGNLQAAIEGCRSSLGNHYCGVRRFKFEGAIRLRGEEQEFLVTATGVTREPLMEFSSSDWKLDWFNGGQLRT